MQTGLHKKYRYSCQILNKLEFSGQIREKYSNIKKILKIRAVGIELFHAEGQTDRTNLIIPLCAEKPVITFSEKFSTKYVNYRIVAYKFSTQYAVSRIT
jgi:hypothetical protein